MLPALTTKPKQAVRQVKGLTNDSIDSYSNTPLGGGSGIGGGVTATYMDNTESGSGTARGSPPATSRATISTGRATVAKASASEEGATMARVMRDRKASGEEELSLRTGDVVKVLSTKRTGYLKCEAGDEVGYVPSSYLEFLDGRTEAENGNGTATEEVQRAAEKQRKKQQRKEKRKKEKRDANEASDPEEGAPVSARSPRKEAAAEEEGMESPRKSKKKSRKHRQDREALEASGLEEPSSSTRSRAAPEETERSRSKSKSSKKKRHRDAESSDSSGSDGGKRSARHGRRRRHRRGSSGSDSDSTSSDGSDGSYRRRRRRRRHRHRRSSSEEEEDDDSDYKRRSRRSKKRRDKGDGDSEPEEGSRSVRKAEKKKMAAALQDVEKGVGQLDVKSDDKAANTAQAKATTTSSKKEEPDRDRGKKEETERSEGSSEGRATSVSTSRKDDEGRASTSTSSSGQKQHGNKAGLGRQIGEKMRSFLGGSKKQHGSKGSSGILNACPGTVQGEEGWYEHGENERYYFVLLDGRWSLLYGPMTEDDFEVFSNRVLEQNRSIELPPTYLHKSGYYLNRELRVQKEQ